MRLLFTGGSSPLGARVLGALAGDERFAEIWCGVHRREVPFEHPKLRRVPLALGADMSLAGVPAPLDLVVHFAGLTHARDEARYWEVNHRGTLALAAAARSLGCRRFVYVSTRCATEGSGAYGESKLAAERGLRGLGWESLLVIRPSEIYGGGGSEGVDKFLSLASRFRVVPLLWGHRRLRFAPLRADDFVAACVGLIEGMGPGERTIELCGPEELSGAALGWRIARRRRALPVPVWWPALAVALRALGRAGLHAVEPDQIARLVGRKTAARSTPDPALARPPARFMEEAAGDE
jgi:nucleoside-diphosphate-sugar epimerase